MLLYPMRTPYNEFLRFLKIKLIKSNNFPSNLFSFCFKYNNFFVTIKWGASSRWSSRPNSAYGSLETTAIGKTHPTLILMSLYLFTNFDRIFLWVIYNWTAWWYMGWFPLVIGPFKDHSLTFWCHCRIFLIRKRLGQFTHGHLHLHQCVEKKNNSISHFRATRIWFWSIFFLFQLDISNRRSSLLREVPRIWVFSLFFEIRFSRPLVVKKGGEKKGSLRVAKKRKLDRLTKPKPKGPLESKWTRPMRRIGQFLQF